MSQVRLPNSVKTRRCEREAEIADAVDDEALMAAALRGLSYQKPISR